MRSRESVCQVTYRADTWSTGSDRPGERSRGRDGIRKFPRIQEPPTRVCWPCSGPAALHWQTDALPAKNALPDDDYHLPPRAYRQRYHQGRPLPSKAMRDACTWPSTTETAARARRLPKLDPPDVADCDPERVNRKQNIRGVPPTFCPRGCS